MFVTDYLAIYLFIYFYWKLSHEQTNLFAKWITIQYDDQMNALPQEPRSGVAEKLRCSTWDSRCAGSTTQPLQHRTLECNGKIRRCHLHHH